jgi:hypothetical protein
MLADGGRRGKPERVAAERDGPRATGKVRPRPGENEALALLRIQVGPQTPNERNER